MNRRNFFKTVATTLAAGTAAVAAPAVGRGGETDYRPHFWLLQCNVFGYSFIDNIRYDVVGGIKAAEYNLGDRLLMPDGNQYVCAGHYENPNPKTR